MLFNSLKNSARADVRRQYYIRRILGQPGEQLKNPPYFCTPSKYPGKEHIKKSMSYCSYIVSMAGEQKALHKAYHDNHYGFPIHDDNELFGRLIMEINQAGLSWEIILKKEAGFRKAYHNFQVKKIAAYTEADRKRLLNDAGIIRNRLKINAAIENANTILRLQQESGSFEKWLQSHHPRTKDEWVKLFKKTFRFTGGEIVGEFLMSIGYLPGAHSRDCPVYKKILKAKPVWHIGGGIL